jgi:transposase
MFQHDNAGTHVARICTQFLEAEHFSALPWPAYSPDMSTIDHVWDALDQHFYDSAFQFPPISSNFAQPLKRSGTTFYRPQSTA